MVKSQSFARTNCQSLRDFILLFLCCSFDVFNWFIIVSYIMGQLK